MNTITTRQADYIDSLRDLKGYKAEFTAERVREDGYNFSRDVDAYVARHEAGVAALNADIDGISREAASEIIDALKAW